MENKPRNFKKEQKPKFESINDCNSLEDVKTFVRESNLTNKEIILRILDADLLEQNDIDFLNKCGILRKVLNILKTKSVPEGIPLDGGEVKVETVGSNKNYEAQNFTFYTREKIDLDKPRNEIYNLISKNLVRGFFGNSKISAQEIITEAQKYFTKRFVDEHTKYSFFSQYYLKDSDRILEMIEKVIKDEKSVESVGFMNISPYSSDFLENLKSHKNYGNIADRNLDISGSSIVKIIEQLTNFETDEYDKYDSCFSKIPNELNINRAVFVFVALNRFNKISSLGGLEKFLKNPANTFFSRMSKDITYNKIKAVMDYFFSQKKYDLDTIGRFIGLHDYGSFVKESSYSLRVIFLSGIISLFKNLLDSGNYVPNISLVKPTVLFIEYRYTEASDYENSRSYYEALITFENNKMAFGKGNTKEEANNNAIINEIIEQNIKRMN